MKLLIVQAAALGYELWERRPKAEFWRKLKNQRVKTIFPALTCPVQASFRTASEPSSHGIISNGFFDRGIKRTFFWEQSSSLFAGERIWERFRSNGGTVGQICWQQSIGNDSDLILSPTPIHKHHGGLIQDFYSKPQGLYTDLCKKIGRKFNLFSYWGPFASFSSTLWIAEAASELLKSGCAADLLLVYLPHLDYSLQKYGTNDLRGGQSFEELQRSLEILFVSAKLAGYEIVIFGDYAITCANHAVFPNKILIEKGYFSTRNVAGRLYPDFYNSKAFAMADHQVAHLYINDKSDIPEIKKIFEGLSGIARVMEHNELAHERSGELILEASPGCWFAYQWWSKRSEAPDYAAHVDIHNKPGFDPCELFMSAWPPFSVSQDTSEIRGTHGSANSPEHDVLWASSFDSDRNLRSLVDAALMIKEKI